MLAASRDALIILGVLLVAATYTIATLVEVLRQPEGARYQSGSKTTWVLVIVFTGVLGAAIYQLAGRPTDGRTLAHRERPAFHRIVRKDDPGASSKWGCRDCDFEARDDTAARRHRLVVNDDVPPPPAPRVSGFEVAASIKAAPPTAAASPQTTSPEFKPCPDCAEDIRFAARKCRFCGYRYVEVEASSNVGN